MKLVYHAAPFALALISGLGCTPSANRGVGPGVPDDSASDPQQASNGYGGDSREADREPALAPVDPPVRPPSAAVRPVQVPRPSPYRVRVVDGEMRDLRTFFHDGRTYVLGTIGQRYAVVLS